MEINPAITFKHDRSVMYSKRPKVLIVGAGLGGLTLGMLLHKADIPFEIYERASEVKPLGSAMYFNSTTANLFKQCGIYDEFVAIGKYVSSLQFCNEDRQVDFHVYFTGHESEFGAKGYIVTRPQLYDLLLRQIPKERIHLGKKVLTMDQGGNGVLIRFSDASEAEGDILVGADGAYSAVRQGLYAKLKKTNKLPLSDDLPLPFSTWSTFTTAQNTVAYNVVLFLDEETSKTNDAFRNSEWGPEAAMAMCEEVKDFPVISGGNKELTLGDLFAWSNKEQISKVMLEEKVFKTWYDCRTVLIGDGKTMHFSPSGGAGAANAMHDAIALANRINGLPFHPIADEIEDAFKEYKAERIDWVITAFNSSKTLKNMAGQSISSMIARTIMRNIPGWLMRRIETRQFCHRPQVAFLPLVEDKGTFPPAHQPSLSVNAPQEGKSQDPADDISEQATVVV
ncbi:hypothetical protein BGZ95_010487 [Linnemannia exigua]|uniref:FAD-binding domain-containing protein n=1 Tax=Linnemannia exigua TaxID=604196 RepID=A0AAD4DBA2_9FUNG|nr:hypothetical protein BGZ95_010487 [Linnemannia exigua]